MKIVKAGLVATEAQGENASNSTYDQRNKVVERTAELPATPKNEPEGHLN